MIWMHHTDVFDFDIPFHWIHLSKANARCRVNFLFWGRRHHFDGLLCHPKLILSLYVLSWLAMYIDDCVFLRVATRFCRSAPRIGGNWTTVIRQAHSPREKRLTKHIRNAPWGAHELQQIAVSCYKPFVQSVHLCKLGPDVYMLRRYLQHQVNFEQPFLTHSQPTARRTPVKREI